MDVLTPRLRNALFAYRASLELAFPARVRKVLLFGSFARGEATQDSDVDVLVVLDRLDGRERARALDLAAEAALAHGFVFEPVVLSDGEWEELKKRELLFREEVERDGVEI